MADNTITTGCGDYPSGRPPHFSEGVFCRAYAYPPGVEIDAHPGAPVFKVHAVVLTAAGRVPEIIVHANAGAQYRWLRRHGFVT